MDTFETNDELCVVTEYAFGDLYQILSDDKDLPEESVKGLSRQLIQVY